MAYFAPESAIGSRYHVSQGQSPLRWRSPRSACRRRLASCSRKPVTNAARPTAGRSKRGLRVGVRPYAGPPGIDLDSPAAAVRGHQQTESWLVRRTTRRGTEVGRCASSDATTDGFELGRFNDRKSSGTCRPFVLTADCCPRRLEDPVFIAAVVGDGSFYRIVYRYFSSGDFAFPRLSLHPQSLQRPPYRTNVLVGAGDNGRAAWATEVMVLECQTRGPVEGLHAVSLGDLFDIRRAVWRVCGHGLHGRILEPRRTIACS